DALIPDAPTLPTTPAICYANETEFSGQAATLDVRLLVGAMGAPEDGLPTAFTDCVGDGAVWEILDIDGARSWLGIVGASDGLVDGIDAAAASDLPLALHVATNRDTDVGTDVFALTLA